jgi:hypothetical protein
VLFSATFRLTWFAALLSGTVPRTLGVFWDPDSCPSPSPRSRRIVWTSDSIAVSGGRGVAGSEPDVAVERSTTTDAPPSRSGAGFPNVAPSGDDSGRAALAARLHSGSHRIVPCVIALTHGALVAMRFCLQREPESDVDVGAEEPFCTTAMPGSEVHER